MPTPDEVYEQVLKEETDKGSAPAVAQGRAKAARVRAQRGASQPNTPDPATAPPPDRIKAALGGAPAAEAQPQPQAEATEQPKAAAAASKPAAQKPAARPSSGAPTKRAVGNGAGPAVPERVQRLLAVVKPEAIQKV